MLSYTEENYLKALYRITRENGQAGVAGTNELALQLGVRPATVHDMLKKLKEKKLITYEKYGKINMTRKGEKAGVDIVRKHRLWETFLFEKLDFSWDEVHELAEELEHIQSSKLIDRLDKFLNYPDVDPHGDQIPNSKGEIKKTYKTTLADIRPGDSCRIQAVKDNSKDFLRYMLSLQLTLQTKVKVVSVNPYDKMLLIEFNKTQVNVSRMFAENLFVHS